MGKTKTTISVDDEIRTAVKEDLKSKGMNLSFWIEQCMRKHLENKEQEGNK